MAKLKVEIELDFDKWGRDFWIFDPEWIEAHAKIKGAAQ